MEEIRTRARTVVKDAATGEQLQAWYRQLCKRPCFHDQYLQAFNEPAAVLLDTDGQGVEEITETGVVVGDNHYEVDCIIYASGFEVGTPFTERAGFDPAGKGGLRLSQRWAEGMRSLHGTHVAGFPNLFIVQPTQGANLISNVPHNLTESGQAIAAIVAAAEAQGAQSVEVTEEAEKAWIELLLSAPPPGHDRLAGVHAGVLQQRGAGPGPGGPLSHGLSRGSHGLFPLPAAVVGRGILCRSCL